MKLLSVKPKKTIKFLRVVILFITFYVFLPSFSYADWYKIFDPVTGVMEIYITDGEDIYITKHLITGGLAINGVCTGVLASQITSLHIWAGEADNLIDLRGMKLEDFPGFGQYSLIQVVAGGGNDKIYGPPDIGANLFGAEGDDWIEGGSCDDVVVGGPGHDMLMGKEGDDNMGGGEDDDIIDGGEGKNYLCGNEGDDDITGNKGDNIDGGPGDDAISINRPEGSGKLLNNSTFSFTNQTYFDADSNGLFITDSSGIDTLSFAPFDSGIMLDLELFNTQQIYTANNDTLTLNGIFENFIGTPHDDVIHVNPLDVPRTLDGGGNENGDTLYVETMGGAPIDDGTNITYSGYEVIRYTNFTEIIFENTLSTDENPILPIGFTLAQNYPNPFNPTTTIHYTLSEESSVNITIYDMLGRKVHNFISQKQFAGNHSIQWNGKEISGNPVSAGIYLYQIQAGEFVQTKKMVLMK